MRIGAVVYVLWFLTLAACCGAVVVHMVRHRARRIGAALLCPLGAVLMFGLVSAGIGLAEGAWNWANPGLWIALLIGAGGVVLTVIGARVVLERPIGAGACRGCGYDRKGLARGAACPECGAL